MNTSVSGPSHSVILHSPDPVSLDHGASSSANPPAPFPAPNPRPTGTRTHWFNPFLKLVRNRPGRDDHAFQRLSTRLAPPLAGLEQLPRELERIVGNMLVPGRQREARERLRIVMSTPLAGIWKLRTDGLGDRFPELATFIDRARTLAHTPIGHHTRQRTDRPDGPPEPICFKDLADDCSTLSMRTFSSGDIEQVRELLQQAVRLSRDMNAYFSRFDLPTPNEAAGGAANTRRKMAQLGELKGWKAIQFVATYGSSAQYRGEIRRQAGKVFTADYLLKKFRRGAANADTPDAPTAPHAGLAEGEARALNHSLEMPDVSGGLFESEAEFAQFLQRLDTDLPRAP